jgi:drug/metabolite transporter superfamily protein YnfA
LIHYYILSAVLEITSCYYFSRGNYALSIPLLILFAHSLSLQPYEPAKTYVIYGGIYILISLVFAYITGITLEIKDYIGIALLLTGVLLLL